VPISWGKSLAKLKKKTTLIPKNEIPPVGDLPIGSRIPFSPNPLFEGRVDDLKKIAVSLLGESNTGVVVNQAITGMGGLGKTQLAVEFAYRYGRYYRGVHWLDLADPSLLDSEIAQCGAQMSLANFPADQPSQVALTLNTWKADGPRLLVLDNFEAVEQVDNVLTRLRHSSLHLLVTSRRTDWTPASGLRPLPLELFTLQESLAFLTKALENRKDVEADLKTLAERLGHLPLALELASRYLKGHARLAITEYLTQLQKAFDHPSMRDWRLDHPAATQHDLDLGHTFALSFQELILPERSEAQSKDIARNIFLTAGYLAPNSAIALEIFEKALEITSETCDEALDTLYGLGLLRKSEDDQPTIHPLLAEYARGLAKEIKEILESLAVSLNTLASEANQTDLPLHFTPIHSHMPVIASHAEEAGLQVAGNLWNNYGYHLDMIANYSGAVSAYERALKVEPEDATYINNLAGVYYAQSDLTGARTMFEHALRIDESSFGSDHPNVAVDLNNLGMVMQDSGDLAGARTMFERALKIGEVALGLDHPKVALRVNNLGSVMKRQGDLEGARTMYERALKIDEAAFGSDHPNVAYEVNNLAVVYVAQGDLASARKMYERALAIFKKFLPPDHPNIKTVQKNLDSLENK
jgi:tetratricopeptide (TPR) repeat protein